MGTPATELSDAAWTYDAARWALDAALSCGAEVDRVFVDTLTDPEAPMPGTCKTQLTAAVIEDGWDTDRASLNGFGAAMRRVRIRLDLFVCYSVPDTKSAPDATVREAEAKTAAELRHLLLRGMRATPRPSALTRWEWENWRPVESTGGVSQWTMELSADHAG